MPLPTTLCSFCLLLILVAFAVDGSRAQPADGTADATAEVPWWNEGVVYQAFVRSFADASDGPLACDGIGDFQGMLERLDYLNDGDPATTDDLGVTTLWLLPIMESPSYHGYDIVDYYTTERDYGTNEDFQRLLDTAHDRGMRVILDLVLNHTSSAHPWFQAALYELEGWGEADGADRSWYIFHGDDPGWRGPWEQEVWHEFLDAHYYGVFVSQMPDLNFRTPAVTEQVYEISRYWLEDVGVDGFRLDAIRHLVENGPVQENTEETHDWLRAYDDYLDTIAPEALTVGEVWDATENVAPYVRDDEMDLAFDFDLANAMLEAVRTGTRAPLDAQVEETLRAFPPHQFGSFLRNHDQSRIMTDLEGRADQAAAAATLLLTLPGVPFLYYGEEIGMVGPKPDPYIRTPMQWTDSEHAGFSACEPWQPVNADYRTLNVEEQSAREGSLLDLYRRLIHLRTGMPALHVGDFHAVASDVPAVYAFLRRAGGETALVVVNLSDGPVDAYALSAAAELPSISAAREVLRGASAGAPKATGDGFKDYQPISTLAPYTGYVVVLE